MTTEGWSTDSGSTPPEQWAPPPPPSATPWPPAPPVAPPAPPAPPSASIWAPPTGAIIGTPPPPPPVDPLQVYDTPEPTPRKARVGLVAVAAVATVGALLAGLFAVTSLTAADGAGSPEGAVEDLFDAINDEDAIGALESLAPGEREMLVEPLQDVQAELTRLNVSSEFDLQDVPGIDLESADLELQVIQLTDDIARVEVVGGTLTATSVPAELPAGPLVTDQMAEDGSSLADVEPETDTVDFAEDPFSLVAIERGGSWHVSLAYSIAEAIRQDSGGSFGKIGQGPDPVGSDSPEAAVRDMADALTQLDDGGDEAITHLVTLLPPDELGVAYDYLPVWLTETDEGGSEDSFSDDYESTSTIEISDLDLSADGDGSVRRVRVNGFKARTEYSYSYTDYADEPYSSSDVSEVVFDGECIETTTTYTSSGYDDYDSGYENPHTETFCKGDVDDSGYGDPFSMGLSSVMTWSPTFTVVEVDGRWYVSPVRSVLDSTVETLRAMSPEDLQKLIDEWSNLNSDERRFEAVGEPIEGPDYSGSLYAQCDPILDDLSIDATDEEWDAAYDAYDACLDGGSTPTSTTVPVTPTTAAPPAVDPFLACDYIIDALPPDASPDEVTASREAYDACFEESQG